MKYRLALIAAIVLAFTGSLLAQRRIEVPARPEVSPQWQCRRIISMAPSITETLYALGLGDRVVGVTRYCRYPPEVREKPPIGGYFDPNYEAILALKPDLIVMLEEHDQSLPGFKKLKLETLIVSHQTIDGIISSFRTIGRVCGRGPEGRQMADDYQQRIDRLRGETQFLPRPRVLLVLDRNFGAGQLSDVYVAGVDNYFDKIIDLAGGKNAYQAAGVRYPVVSPEGILWLNPDVIIDLVGREVSERLDHKMISADWDSLERVEAVRNRRVWVFDQDYACVPGPRFIQLAEELARRLHPEIDWN